MTEREALKKLKEIEMPEDMKKRMIRKCERKMEEKKMSNKKYMAVAASLALCLCLTGVTALAATGKLQGIFKDIKRWDGAVIGTSYEQATDEIEVKVTDVTEELTLEISMINPNAAPYSSFELFGLESYQLVDMDGKKIFEADEANMAEVSEGKVVLAIPLNGVSEGAYKLIINEMKGSSKADQPLVLSGTWEIEFIK